MSRPTPEPLPISHRAPNTPPSVISCIADTPHSAAIFASGITERYWSNFFAVSTKGGAKCSKSKLSFSFAAIEVPSRPIHFVTTISSPGFTEAVVSTFSFFIFPTPVREINVCFTTSVTSVCPPKTSIFSSLQVFSTSCIISFSCASSVSGVKSIVSIIPTGSAPEATKSLAVM